MSNNDFTHFAKRILTDPAKFISWCPVSDLLLIVSPDNALSLYRVAIKQLTLLWSSETAFDSTITSVTWKPDGTLERDSNKLLTGLVRQRVGYRL